MVLLVKNPPDNAGLGNVRDGFHPWVRKIPWRMKWQPTPVFLPGEIQGQRTLVGYGPQGHRVRHNWIDLAGRGQISSGKKKKTVTIWHVNAAAAKSLQSCLTVCDPIDCSPPRSSVHGFLQARILEWVAIPFSRGVFPTQGSNPSFPHCRQILYYLSHRGSPFCL